MGISNFGLDALASLLLRQCSRPLLLKTFSVDFKISIVKTLGSGANQSSVSTVEYFALIYCELLFSHSAGERKSQRTKLI